MKVERVSEHIWACKAWLVFPMRVWLVRGPGGVTLVDTGMGFMARGIWKAICMLDAGPLERIVLTHGHPDHVGGLKKLLRLREVPVYAHRLDIPCMEGKRTYREGKPASATVEPGLVQALDEDEAGRLLPVAGLQPYWTPGHSPGHVVYYHEQDNVLLGGDLFTSRKGRIRVSPFTPDAALSVRSSAVIGTLRPDRAECCHGKPLFSPADQIEAYMSEYAAFA